MKQLGEFKVGECFKDTLRYTWWIVLEQLDGFTYAENALGLKARFLAESRQEQKSQVDFLAREALQENRAAKPKGVIRAKDRNRSYAYQ
jgi:hypothetical protein